MGQGKFAGQRQAFYHCATQPKICIVRALVSDAEDANRFQYGPAVDSRKSICTRPTHPTGAFYDRY